MAYYYGMPVEAKIMTSEGSNYKREADLELQGSKVLSRHVGPK